MDAVETHAAGLKERHLARVEALVQLPAPEQQAAIDAGAAELIREVREIPSVLMPLVIADLVMTYAFDTVTRRLTSSDAPPLSADEQLMHDAFYGTEPTA